MRSQVRSLALLHGLRIQRCSSNSTPSLETSICCRCSSKKQKKKKVEQDETGAKGPGHSTDCLRFSSSNTITCYQSGPRYWNRPAFHFPGQRGRFTLSCTDSSPGVFSGVGDGADTQRGLASRPGAATLPVHTAESTQGASAPSSGRPAAHTH